jgi:hypothetical protein
LVKIVHAGQNDQDLRLKRKNVGFEASQDLIRSFAVKRRGVPE